jgi:hypothetical protein
VFQTAIAYLSRVLFGSNEREGEVTKVQRILRRAFGNVGTRVKFKWRESEDVPKFLKRLDAWEKKSKRSKLIIR